MTYTYEIIETGETIDVEQRITEDAHTVLEIDGEFKAVRRLINGGGNFTLLGGGWASDGYAKSPGVRKAEQVLGRPVNRKK